MKRALLLAALAVVLPAIVYAQTTGDQFGDTAVPDIIPWDDSVGPVANTVAEFKFDDGFYEKISRIMEEPQLSGDPGVFDGVRYYDVILVVSRDDGDDRDPDEVARENKAALVKRLELLGARDIVAAGALSFVTASVPVAEVPGFSLHEEVFKLGDGEIPVVPEVDDARATVNASVGLITTAAGRSLDGTGVRVAVIDTGINHTSAFGDRIIDRVSCTGSQCNDFSGPIYASPDRRAWTSHGTQVAQVLGASGLAANNGIAPGVEILDVGGVSDALSLARALDWSLLNGADVVNMSYRIQVEMNWECSDNTAVFDLITNEAVDKGMVFVKSAGNQNRGYA